MTLVLVPVYLDHQATTPCDPRVVEAMLPCFGGQHHGGQFYGNAASRQHAFGRRAEGLVNDARGQVAALLACDPREVVFTSGATESINLALKGVAASAHHQGRQARRHIVTGVTEHKAVLDVCQRLEGQHLEKDGYDVTYLPVDEDGRVRPEDVRGALRDDTLLVSLMYANNEIGVIHPIEEIGAICKERGVLFHCDAVQALGYLDCDVDRLGVDLLSISGHKIHGPKGVGALYVRRRRPRVRLEALLEGGGHERGMRSGTLNVPGIVGLGRASFLVAQLRDEEAERLARLRDLLLELLADDWPKLRVNGSLQHRLPHNLNVSLPGVDAETLMANLETVAISSGAACSSASVDGSYVLKALPGGREHAESSIRLGLGRFTTEVEIRYAAAEITTAARAVLNQPTGHQATGQEPTGHQPFRVACAAY